jgi:seryl-tRNA(Sec) selenium transferase
MKPKTFTYNEMIQFFINHNMPLKDTQVQLIAMMVREEFKALETYREEQKKKRDAKILKALKRKESRIARKCNKVQKSVVTDLPAGAQEPVR